MNKTLLAAITVTALLVSSSLPAAAEYYQRGDDGYGSRGGWHGGSWSGGDGGWRGGGWNGGDEAALGFGLGLGLLGGALATVPYYAAPNYAPAPAAPASWYWCDPYQQYYPYVTACPTPWRQVVQWTASIEHPSNENPVP
jgi:hypothetical protein